MKHIFVITNSMRKIILLIVFCLVIAVRVSQANDGAFYASGNTLMPLQETDISLKKEILKFYIKDFNWMSVSVEFEFYNPGAEKKLTVGFVTPPADGDVSDEDSAHPRIKNFTVSVNGKNLAYKIRKMQDTSFSIEKLKIDGNDFVYYFPVTFKRGLNKISHTYLFQGGGGVELARTFDYQITTGKRWANKQIDDFELQIHLDNGIFSIPASFRDDGTLAMWKIIGDGIIENKTDKWFETEDSPVVKMVHLNNGYLVLKEKNFRPNQDIMIGEYNWAAGWVHKMCKNQESCSEDESLKNVSRHFTLRPYNGYEETDFEELTVDEIKLVRNYFFAVRGYGFADKMIDDFYSQFFWYKPDKNLKAQDIKLSEREQVFISTLKRVEEKRKRQTVQNQ